jgi:hypothetical protein
MELEWLWNFGPIRQGGWLTVGSGVAVCCTVFLGMLYVSRRSRISMLDIILRRSGRRSQRPADEEVPDGEVTPEALAYLKTPMADLAYLQAGSDRRRSARKWGNPVEVQIHPPDSAIPLRGVVINRSTGGVAILVDDAYQTGARLMLRAVQAPAGVGWIAIEVRNCRAAGKNHVIGCSYPESPPWNAVVWLG